MAWSFRRRKKIAPGVHLNISKSGVSTNIGKKGASVTLGPKGSTLNIGIPGTGLYSRTKLSGTDHQEYDRTSKSELLSHSDGNVFSGCLLSWSRFLIWGLMLIGLYTGITGILYPAYPLWVTIIQFGLFIGGYFLLRTMNGESSDNFDKRPSAARVFWWTVLVLSVVWLTHAFPTYQADKEAGFPKPFIESTDSKVQDTSDDEDTAHASELPESVIMLSWAIMFTIIGVLAIINIEKRPKAEVSLPWRQASDGPDTASGFTSSVSSSQQAEQSAKEYKDERIFQNISLELGEGRLYEAAKFVVLSQRGSTSEMQRRLGMGYAKAGRTMDMLEKLGIVGPQNGAAPRVVYINSVEDLNEIFRNLSLPQKHTGEKEPKLNIDDLIGLESVKSEVKSLSNFIKMQKQREKEGLKVPEISYHCVFTGNPGTGKTTVARIVAQTYKDLGILKKGHLVETDRSGLVAEYVGQTAVKTNKIIDSALDGVLFIDEAYSLVDGGSADYGKEAIASLLKRMEDDRDRLVVILAGYTADMKRFIESNPGLQSRFNRYIEFPDYSKDELYMIFLSYLSKYEYVLSPEANKEVKETIAYAVDNKDEKFGNARFIRNFFEKVISCQANRLSGENSVSAEALRCLELSDICQAEIV